MSFVTASALTELNVNSNRLKFLPSAFFENLQSLESFSVGDNDLTSITFLSKLFSINLATFDLSENAYSTQGALDILESFPKLKNPKASGLNLSVFSSLLHLETLDLSRNNLRGLVNGMNGPISALGYPQGLIYLDLSFTNFETKFFDDENDFVEKFLSLKHLNFSASLRKSLTNKKFVFNKVLENIDLSMYSLAYFPKFCQNCYSPVCKENKI
jgi:hypothetical protein